jgi:Protein of unknown function (DUF2934)
MKIMKSNMPRTGTKKTAGATHKNAEIPSGLYQRIATRAYEIYERRIGQSALDDWLQAEREILQDKPHRGGYAGAEQE